MDDVIARCLDGDQAAWDTIVRQHWRRVFNIAYKFVGRHDQAEDLTQDVFLKLYRSLDTFDRRANFQTWLVSVSRNLCIDHYRSARKEREAINRDVDPNELTPVAPGLSAHAQLEHRDRVAMLRAGARRAAADAAVGGDAARHPGTDLSRDRCRTAAARRHGQVAHQPRAHRVGPPHSTAARAAGRRAQEWSYAMNLTTDKNQDVAIVRVNEARLMYPLLPEFTGAVTPLIGAGSKLVLDLSSVTYVDSATIGCLMDLYRQVTAAGGVLKLAGVQKRVETMLSMTGAHNFLEIHADEAAAVRSFGG